MTIVPAPPFQGPMSEEARVALRGAPRSPSQRAMDDARGPAYALARDAAWLWWRDYRDLAHSDRDTPALLLRNFVHDEVCTSGPPYDLDRIARFLQSPTSAAAMMRLRWDSTHERLRTRT